MKQTEPSIIYFAAPLQTFPTERYDHLRSAIWARFPHSLILEPKYLYTSNRDWLARWDATRSILKAVIFITDEDGCYGAGVALELDEARARKLPIWYCKEHRSGSVGFYRDYPGGLFAHVHEAGTGLLTRYRMARRTGHKTSARKDA